MTVSVATAEDLAKILCWLEYEYIESGTEGFWCNRRLIAQSLDRSELYVVKYDGQAVAFQTGHYFDGIICVQKTLQKRGFGRELLDATIKRAFRNNVNVLRGECSPVSSLSYWEKHGFTRVGSGPIIEVQPILNRQFEIPLGLPKNRVEVFVYPESVKWKPNTERLSHEEAVGARLENGITKLSRRMMQEWADIIDSWIAGKNYKPTLYPPSMQMLA